MKVKGLDGREHNWKLGGHQPLGSDTRPRSQFHVRARKLLEDLFPSDTRCEEVSLPGSGGLSADFVVPSRGLVVEVHGRQHYSFVAHFHLTKLGFLQSKIRDQNKRDWCALNGLRLIELSYKETISEWRDRILNREENSEG